MAVGDFTINGNTRVSLGNATQISGTVETDTNATTSAIFPKSYILAFTVNYNEDDDDAVVPRVHINSSDFASTAASGSIHMQSSAGAPDTVNWTAVIR
jgi:hypothetical protein|tara:strand:- start:298 stop:591 length:294 start_codon:yes stop_codon:yes gene_type:complete